VERPQLPCFRFGLRSIFVAIAIAAIACSLIFQWWTCRISFLVEKYQYLIQNEQYSDAERVALRAFALHPESDVAKFMVFQSEALRKLKAGTWKFYTHEPGEFYCRVYDPHHMGTTFTQRSAEDKKSVVDEITSIVAPSSWLRAGGSGSLEYFEMNEALVVWQTEEVHALVARYLKDPNRPQAVAEPNNSHVTCTRFVRQLRQRLRVPEGRCSRRATRLTDRPGTKIDNYSMAQAVIVTPARD
jgi:hypothetical protein